MLKHTIAATLLFLLPVIVVAGTIVLKVSDKYTLLEIVERCDIVVVGTVSLKTGVYVEHPRNNDGSSYIMSEIVVRVETQIKGEPNFGENHVRFMIEGGTAYVPRHQQVMTLVITNDLDFKVGEKVMLFLSRDSPNGYYDNFPYGRLHVNSEFYGKRLIKDNKITMFYKKSDIKLRGVRLPVEMASLLAQAAVADKDAAVPLENKIKTLARSDDATLTETIINDIKTGAKTIIDAAEEDE